VIRVWMILAPSKPIASHQYDTKFMKLLKKILTKNIQSHNLC
jgi:hypothetical protein